MTDPAFVELVGKLLEAMDQTMEAARPVPEGLLVQTNDDFVYVFLEDPTQVSLAALERIFTETGDSPPRLVFLTRGRLPLALLAEVSRRGSTLVDGARFQELVKSFGLETYLGLEPRAEVAPDRSRLLPSAQQLDSVMNRGRTWFTWGVPALALRFYRQAADQKPGFLPAKVGIARSLLALGLASDADRAFDEVLGLRPDDLDARMGKASVLGARGRPKEEIDLYRKLLEEDSTRSEVRAHLIAALIDLPAWTDAQEEIELMLHTTPEDPRLRFLHGVALGHTGQPRQGEEERERARVLGLTLESERALCEHLGMPEPKPREPSSVGGTPPVAVLSRSRSDKPVPRRGPPHPSPAAERRNRAKGTTPRRRKAK
ncbi:MAG: tetratricopeptide repeat protein [Thermoplasmata archaeon]